MEGYGSGRSTISSFGTRPNWIESANTSWTIRCGGPRTRRIRPGGTDDGRASQPRWINHAERGGHAGPPLHSLDRACRLFDGCRCDGEARGRAGGADHEAAEAAEGCEGCREGQGEGVAAEDAVVEAG